MKNFEKNFKHFHDTGGDVLQGLYPLWPTPLWPKVGHFTFVANYFPKKKLATMGTTPVVNYSLSVSNKIYFMLQNKIEKLKSPPLNS